MNLADFLPRRARPRSSPGGAAAAAIVATLALVTTAVAPSAIAAQSPDHDALRRLKTVDWPRAYLTRDTLLLDRILDDGFRMIRSDGRWSSKQAELEWLRTHGPTYDSLAFRITRLDVHPNGTAVVAGTGVVFATEGGEPAISEYESTNVLIKRSDGRWRAIASHTSGHRARHPTASRGIVDHHVHVLGPDVLRDWKAIGVTFSRPDSIYLSPQSLLSGRGDSLSGAVLVPMAHLYANPEFVAELRIDDDEVRRRVRRENVHVAAEASRAPGRTVALCSVPVLATWALDELRWCRDSLASAGLKLHLASSQVDLRDASHRARLAGIARFAAGSDLPILLHVDPQRRGHDSTHIRAMAEQVFGPYPDLAVVVAHLGGSGGYGPWTRTVFRTLRRWRAEVERNGPRRRIHFELSAVVLERESEGVPATTDAEVELLRSDLRADGLDRVVFGSDYPVFDPVRGRGALIERLGLTAAEVDQVTRGAEAGIFRARRCVPPLTPAQRRELATRRFGVSDAERVPLAFALLPCLADPDPALRDGLATAALTAWLRAGLLPAGVVQVLTDRTLAMLAAPRDTAGFRQSFAALALSELVRADRLDSALSPATLASVSEVAIAHLTAIRDYRGFEADAGWRHDVAHTAELALQLGVHPRVGIATVERLLDALASQVGAHDGHTYLDAEPERLARAVVLIHASGRVPIDHWDRWLQRVAAPGPLVSWGRAFETAAGRARRLNTLAFLHTLSLAARLASPTPHSELLALVDRELRRLVTV